MECPECIKNNKHSKLKLYQINLIEAIYMCPEKLCNYPNDKKWNTVQQNLFNNDFDVENDSTDSDIETITKIFTNHARKKIRKKSRLKNLNLTSSDSNKQNSSDDETTINRAFNILTCNINRNGKKIKEKVEKLLDCDKLNLSGDSSDSDFNFSDLLNDSASSIKNLNLNLILHESIKIVTENQSFEVCDQISADDLNVSDLDHFDSTENIQGSEPIGSPSFSSTNLINSIDLSQKELNLPNEETFTLGISEVLHSGGNHKKSLDLSQNEVNVPKLSVIGSKEQICGSETPGVLRSGSNCQKSLDLSLDEINVSNSDYVDFKGEIQTSGSLGRSSCSSTNIGNSIGLFETEKYVPKVCKSGLQEETYIPKSLELSVYNEDNPKKVDLSLNELNVSKLNNIASKLENRALGSSEGFQFSGNNFEKSSNILRNERNVPEKDNFEEENSNFEKSIGLIQNYQNVPKLVNFNPKWENKIPRSAEEQFSVTNSLSVPQNELVPELDNSKSKREDTILKPLGNPLISVDNLKNSLDDPNVPKMDNKSLNLPQNEFVLKLDNFDPKEENMNLKSPGNPLISIDNLKNSLDEPSVPKMDKKFLNLSQNEFVLELDHFDPKEGNMNLKSPGNPLISDDNLKKSLDEPNVSKSEKNFVNQPQNKFLPELENSVDKIENGNLKSLGNPLIIGANFQNFVEEPNVPKSDHLKSINVPEKFLNDLGIGTNLEKITKSDKNSLPQVGTNLKKSINSSLNETKVNKTETEFESKQETKTPKSRENVLINGANLEKILNQPKLEDKSLFGTTTQKFLPFPIKINISSLEKGQTFDLTLENSYGSNLIDKPMIVSNANSESKIPKINIETMPTENLKSEKTPICQVGNGKKDLTQQKMDIINNQKRILKVFSKEKLEQKDFKVYGKSKIKEISKFDVTAALRASGVQNGAKIQILKPVKVIKGLKPIGKLNKSAAKFEGFKFTTKIIKKADSPKKSDKNKLEQVINSEKINKSEDSLVQSPPDVSSDLNLSNIQINESFSLDKCNISNLDELLNDIDLENSNLSQQTDCKNLDDVDDWLKSLVN